MIFFGVPNEGAYMILYSLDESIDNAYNEKVREKLIKLKLNVKRGLRAYMQGLDPKEKLPKVDDFRLHDEIKRINNMRNEERRKP